MVFQNSLFSTVETWRTYIKKIIIINEIVKYLNFTLIFRKTIHDTCKNSYMHIYCKKISTLIVHNLVLNVINKN